MNEQSNSVTKKRLRLQLRQLRQKLSNKQLSDAGEQLAVQYQRQFNNKLFNTVAVYLQHDSELDTNPLIELFFQSDAQVYLPKIDDGGSKKMQFLRYQTNSKMQNNRFGIPEPITDEVIDLQNIDLLLMPLSAFDLSGNRLGMGGGYYDRALSSLSNKLSNKKPLIVGLAYDFQQVDECPVEVFDQPLQMILTPTRAIAF